MTEAEKIATLAAALRMCATELLILSSRLPNPYAKNCASAVDAARSAFKLTEQDPL